MLRKRTRGKQDDGVVGNGREKDGRHTTSDDAYTTACY